ncbi:MAG: hypothetical protein GWP60_06610 [Gammaproteobacteria bacterium]|jgi:hypothetical protein|nr:hypothetical protein [Gammaproteobacteria bacterium]
MWKNKHVIIALIVAPILAILAWFAVGQIAGEKAQVAEPGGAYPLVARSNCRWESGECELVNNDLKMTILPLELGAQYTRLSLDSEFPLAQATFALLSDGNEVVASAEYDASPDAAAQMTVTIPTYADPEGMLRVAVTVRESLYFAEVPVVFMRPEERRFSR